VHISTHPHFHLQNVFLPNSYFPHQRAAALVQNCSSSPEYSPPCSSDDLNIFALSKNTKTLHPVLPAMPLNRQELVSSSIGLLRKALLSLQVDQQAAKFLVGQELAGDSDAADDKPILQLQTILQRLACQVDEYLTHNACPLHSENSRSSPGVTLTAPDEEDSPANSEPTSSCKDVENDLLLLDLVGPRTRIVQGEKKQSLSDETRPTPSSKTLDNFFSLDGDKADSNTFRATPAEANQHSQRAEVEQEPLWRTSAGKGNSNLLLSLSSDVYCCPLGGRGSYSTRGLNLQPELGLVPGAGRRSQFPCRIDLTQSFYGKSRSYHAYDFYDYGEKPYSLRAVLRHNDPSTEVSSMKYSSFIGFELRVMNDQNEPIFDHAGKDDHQPYRTNSIIFPFMKSTRTNNGRRATIKKFKCREASDMMTEDLPKDLIKILGRRQDGGFLSKTLCLDWDCDAAFLTSHANGNELPTPEEIVMWPAVSSAALLFLKVSRWGGHVRLFFYVDDEEELKHWMIHGLPAFDKACGTMG
jgi:hypothetical protein